MEKFGFQISYQNGADEKARVTVKIGFGTHQPWLDCQTVKIEDRQLPFVIDGQVSGNLVTHINLGPHFPMSIDEATEWAKRSDRISTQSPLSNPYSENNEDPSGLLQEHKKWTEERRNLIVQLEQGIAKSARGAIRQGDLQSIPIISMVLNWAMVGREYQSALRSQLDNLDNDDRDHAEFSTGQSSESALLELLVENNSAKFEQLTGTRDSILEATRAEILKISERRDGQRRRGVDKESALHAVINEWKAATARGDRAPSQEVAARLHYHEVTVRKYLAEARRRGLLPPSKPRGIPNKRST